MCFKAGSIEAAVNICPMCKAFPHPRCPHVRDVCRNRNSHPTFDVHYLKNAEVDSFNGCGYCKWANLNPSLKQLDHRNPGWPGCCRPPTTAEARLVQAADWRAVSIVHHVAIPPEIKAMLDSLSKRGAMPPMSGSPRSAPSNNRPANPAFDRRSSNASVTGRPSSSSSKTPAANASRGRSGSSPKQGQQVVGGNLGRSPSGTAISSSVPSSSADQGYRERRADSSSRSSPSRKQDVDGVTSPKRPSHSRRPSVTPAVPSVSVSKIVADARPQNNSQSNVKRRSSVSTSNTPPPKSTNSRPSSFVVPRTPKKQEEDTSSASSSSGSEGLGSLSDSTITSDGAFTDYLSDESEAELQRQAEAKAALVAQSQAEELEFKAARQQLAHVDLRPPRSWNTMSYGVSSKLTPAFTSMQAAAYNLAQTAQTS